MITTMLIRKVVLRVVRITIIMTININTITVVTRTP